jgi:hypothetical protein
MLANRLRVALGAGALLGLTAFSSIASAADLPIKSPPPPPALLDQLDVHGFADVTFLNDYITPRGLLVTNTGLTTQILNGLGFDLYKDKNGWLNNVTISGGVWNDLWSEQHDVAVGPWNEFDWFVGMNFTIAHNWNFGVQYQDFVPPAHDLITSFPSTEHNIEFSLLYDDSSWWGGGPFSLQPYAKLFYAISGPSTVVLGNRGSTYDVELGVVPTFDTSKMTGLPLVFSAPTWITVGPKSYWNRNDGTTNVCGSLSTSPCSMSNAGVVTTGLQAKLGLDAIVPKRFGKWYWKTGARYYHIINDALVAAQEFTGAAGGASNVLGTFASAHRDVGVIYTGIGFAY